MSVNGDNQIEQLNGYGILSHEDSEHQSAYIFTPAEKNHQHDRPVKKRKIAGDHSVIAPADFVYPRLSYGKESQELTARRQRVYKQVWTNYQAIINPILNQCDEETVNALDKFIRDAGLSDQDKIPAAVVVTGASVSSTSALLDQLVEPWTSDGICLLQLASSQATNIKLALKAIIRGVILRIDGPDGYQSYFNLHKKSIPLNYDLELLYQFLLNKGLKRIVLSLTDSEAFDAHLLAELLSVLSAWKDRLPVILIFQVSTSLELFEARLPSPALRLLDGALFEPENHNDSFQEILENISELETSAQDPQVWFGADAAKALLEQSKEQLATPESLALSIKYGLMSHCFANPLSSLLDHTAKWKGDDLKYICSCIRNTSSFRRYIERLLEDQKVGLVKSVFEDDNVLKTEALSAMRSGRDAMRDLFQAVRNLQKITSTGIAAKQPEIQYSDLHIDALSGRLLDTSFYQDLDLSIKRASSDALSQLLDLDLEIPNPDLQTQVSSIKKDLQTLLSTTNPSSLPIRSSHNPLTSTETTVSQHNNRISLSSTPKKATALETKYTAILTRYHDLLITTYFDPILSLDPSRDLFMSEAFIYSSASGSGAKLPLTTAFTPRPRFSIERALSAPSDYLVSDATGPPPATAVLWSLWCDAGALVNVRDLWEAFWSVIRPRDGLVEEQDRGENETESGSEDELARSDGLTNHDINADEEREKVNGGDAGPAAGTKAMDERTGLALFYRSLAELKLLGFVKQSKRKVDCVGKAGWKGL